MTPLETVNKVPVVILERQEGTHFLHCRLIEVPAGSGTLLMCLATAPELRV